MVVSDIDSTVGKYHQHHWRIKTLAKLITMQMPVTDMSQQMLTVEPPGVGVDSGHLSGDEGEVFGWHRGRWLPAVSLALLHRLVMLKQVVRQKVVAVVCVRHQLLSRALHLRQSDVRGTPMTWKID